MKKLEKWKVKLSPIIKESPFNLESHTHTLKSLGFKRLRNIATDCSQYGIVFINKRARLILKESYFVSSSAPKRAIPTVFISDKNQGIVIQPLAKTLNKQQEDKYSYPDGDEWGRDAHSDNLAFYRNKLVLIDW